MARPRVMGVINLTPDSFSDGGRLLDPAAALAQARRMIDQGADILDIGGESTRPGAEPVEEAEEIRRVVGLIAAVRAESRVVLSIDTMKPGVARAAVAAGASLWNDVTALRWSPESLDTAARLRCEVVLMHMRGDPATMQVAPAYEDVVGEVAAFLAERARSAIEAGVRCEAIRLDPGIGFGKTLDHNLALLASLDRIKALGFPVVVGASRKRFIAAIDESARDAGDRLAGSLAAALAAARAGADILRVHDVRETLQALKVEAAITEARLK